MGFFYHNQHGENILNLLTTQLTAFVLCIHLQVQSPSPSPCSQMYLCDSSSVKISPLCSPLLLPSLDPSLSLHPLPHSQKNVPYDRSSLLCTLTDSLARSLIVVSPGGEQVQTNPTFFSRSFCFSFCFTTHGGKSVRVCVCVCVCLHNYMCMLAMPS